MLRLNFRASLGDSPTLLLARWVRLCTDGTVRGPDNFLLARAVDGHWQVRGKLHREMECEGPVSVRVTHGTGNTQIERGRFPSVRTNDGVLYADKVSLDIPVPGRNPEAPGGGHELMLISDGGWNGKA